MAVLIDKKYRWEEGVDEGVHYWFIGAEKPILDLVSFCRDHPDGDLESIGRFACDLVGHFAVILDQGERIIASVDKTRSYPLFYFHQEDRFCVSNSARALRREYGLSEIDETSLLEFNTAGFVTGRGTLFHHLFQIEAGGIVLWDRNQAGFAKDRYYTFFSDVSRKESEEVLLAELDEITNRIFDRIIEEAGDRPVWVPLSGGLDSRLVLCKLKQRGCRNLHAFSYGPAHNYEAKWAKRIAEKIDVPWLFVPYRVRDIRKFFYSEVRRAYWEFSGEYCSLPFMVDEYAVHALKNRGKIDGNTIIVNGQTGDFISGGHCYGYHMKIRPDDTGQYDSGFIAEAIVKKHFSLNRDLLTRENRERIKKKIVSLLNLPEAPGYSAEQVVKAYESWEWQERQAKYVVNGQRSYDFFGCKWALPLWADEYLMFWDKIGYHHKFNQYLYKAYLNHFDFFGLFKTFKPVVWNWQGLSLLAVPIGAFLKRSLGERASKKFYSYASYFGKYQNHYAPFGFWRWILNAKRFKNPFPFYIDILLKENNISI